MLLQLRDYIHREGLVNIQQLSREFQIDFSALRPMLDWWIRKGVISRSQQTQCASACFKCHQALECYRFK